MKTKQKEEKEGKNKLHVKGDMEAAEEENPRVW